MYINEPTDTTSISSNWIYSIVEDENSNLWIATKKGVSKFDRKTEQFSKILFSENENLIAYGLFVSKSNNILINASPSLFIHNPQTNQTKQFTNTFAKDPSIKDYHIPVIEDSQGLIWLASTNNLSYFNPKTEKFTYFYANITNTDSISNSNILSIFEDSNKNIWIGTENGLNKYSKENRKFTKYFNQTDKNSLSNNSIYSIIEDKIGNIWLGTQNGLNKMNFSKNDNVFFSNYTTENSEINHDIVYATCLDKSDNLWIGTLQEISKIDLKPNKFRLYRKSENPNSINLLDNLIASIFKNDDEIIWIGNWGKGLNLYNRKTGHVEHFSTQHDGNNNIPNDFIHTIFKDNENNIWLGTRDGILMFNEQKNSFIRLNEFYNISITSLENHRIFNIIQDKKNNYWIATSNGLYKMNIQQNTIINFNTESDNNLSISGNLVYDIIEDNEGLIWIATATGLDYFEPEKNKFKHIERIADSSNTLCDNYVVSLCEDFQGNIWIGTQSGANKFIKKDSIFEFYSVCDGTPTLVYEMLQDNNKNIWFSTQNGLIKLDYISKKFKTYSVQDGLQSIEFNLNAKYLSTDGEVFFGGMNGFNSFYPDSMSNNKNIPPIVITLFEKTNSNGKLTINTKEHDKIILSHKDYAFTIEFSALDFTNPELNQYAYKMEGISDEWLYIENRRFVPFTNLPAGKYIFHVKGSNNDGVWNEIGTQIIIIIKPPWWRSTAAYIAYIILIIFLIILFIKIREREAIKKRKELVTKVIERTALINKQKTKIEKTHKEIKDSINYASKIQTAVMPDADSFSDLFTDSFIFYKPRDVVSGDFFYIKDINQYKIFAVADCTGHGVPGAFLSMLGISLLNEIIPNKYVTKSNQILNILRERIITQLNQKGRVSVSKDGMDISLCIYNTETDVFQYSGANNPIYIIRDKKDFNETKFSDKKKYKLMYYQETKVLIEIKPTKNPIGIYIKEISFVNHELKLYENDIIYLFSDGFSDQFSGSTKHKYTSKRFKNYLLSISENTFKKQNKLLSQEFNKWKGNYFQIDDVLIMGIKI